MYPTISYLIQGLTGWDVPLPLPTFGVLMALSFLAGAFILKIELKGKENENLLTAYPGPDGNYIYPHQEVSHIVFIAALWGIIGARVFSILEYFDDFIKAPIETLLSFSGLIFYGGLFFAGIAILIFARKRQIKIPHLLDAAAPTLMLSYSIGRIGCQLAGDGDWGIVNAEPKPHWLNFLPDWVWAYSYPHNVIQAVFRLRGVLVSTATFCQTLFSQHLYMKSSFEVFSFSYYG